MDSAHCHRNFWKYRRIVSYLGYRLEAVAAELLREDGNWPSFHPDSFFKRLITLSEIAGRG